ncbi:DNA starvation/stationary phase protection protein [Paenibacillus sp. J31TS4]|uniref:Dps family protein n=1 Tax=Paenibacillus sp. J31TS4 TaxID=2807195 RepID=UPI001B0266AF|nr:DNA starvation/stationary phase protection protein [Paenibacillus sp. J31TS4]GIP38853.1 DNA starvation/stationary phase protection protein [Paenibacillus sp. J31TS4]
MSIRKQQDNQSQLFEQLNKQLANWTLLYTKLHHHHWYIKGPHFFTLHAKFEELYNEAASHIDTIAERLLAIGGKPAATMAEALRLTSLKEASGQENAKLMVMAVLNDFRLLTDESNTLIELADAAGDEGTSDLFTGIVTSLEKHAWMLNAYLHE